MLNSWHCTDNYLVGVLTSEDCVVTSYATSSQFATSSPDLDVSKAVLFGQYILTTLLFLGLVMMIWNRNYKKM